MKRFYTNVGLMATPVDRNHLVNKEYVDAAVNKKIKDSVVAVETNNFDAAYDADAMTLTQATPGAFVIDGVAIIENDRILLAGQTDASQNGIYVVTTLGADGTARVLTRAEDFNDTSKIILNVMIPVQRGMQNSDTTWVLTNDMAITLDSTALTFAKFKAAESTNIYKTTVTGDGATKEFKISHGLNTEHVIVNVIDAATKEVCVFNTIITSANVVTLKSDVVLQTTDAFNVTVVG